MNKLTILIAVVFALQVTSNNAYAGNPDRQGEAGAYELLLNPWARSAGLNGLVVSSVSGVEAMRFNPAGIGRILSNTELMVSHTQYYVGTGLSLNAGGLAQKIGKNSSVGISLMALSFGDIPLTTVNQPAGYATFSPSFFNIGIGYGHVFRDKDGNEKVSVGATVRMVSESIANAGALGVCFDAGVQYVTGKKKQLKFGIALRNIGTKMRFSGDGLAFVGTAPNGTTPLTVEERVAGFEMPSLLHIGISYDIKFPNETESRQGNTNRFTITGMFTANSFSRDQFGLGIEYAFKEMFMARVAYKYENGMFGGQNAGTVSSGLAAGISVHVPFKKGSNRTIGFDYAFEYTQIFQGTHSVGLKLAI